MRLQQGFQRLLPRRTMSAICAEVIDFHLFSLIVVGIGDQ